MHRTAGLAKCFLVLLTLALVIPLAGAAYAADEGWLGVMLQPLTDDIIQAMDLEKGSTGVLVSDVVEESPADRADMEKGDIIIEIDGVAIQSTDQAVKQVKSHSPGENVKMVILRDGKKEVITAELAKRDDIEKVKVLRDMEDQGEDEYYEIRVPRAERILEGVRDLRLGKGGHIGVRIQDITPDLSPYFGVGVNEGVLILEVIEGSPAAKAGLKGGDVVLKVDGKAVCCSQPLVECIREHEPGDKVEITFKRQGETRRMDVEVGEGPGIREIFLGEAGQPGISLWEEEGSGGHMQKCIRVGEGCMGHMGKGMAGGKRKCIIIGDGCCEKMGMAMEDCRRECMMMGEKCEKMGKGMEECKRKCIMMGDKCEGMMGKGMEGCKQKCIMMKDKCKGMMGEGSKAGGHECMGMQKDLMESMDKDPAKFFEKQSLDAMRPFEVRDDLKNEMEELRHEIESLKKEIQELKES